MNSQAVYEDSKRTDGSSWQWVSAQSLAPLDQRTEWLHMPWHELSWMQKKCIAAVGFLACILPSSFPTLKVCGLAPHMSRPRKRACTVGVRLSRNLRCSPRLLNMFDACSEVNSEGCSAYVKLTQLAMDPISAPLYAYRCSRVTLRLLDLLFFLLHRQLIHYPSPTPTPTPRLPYSFQSLVGHPLNLNVTGP